MIFLMNRIAFVQDWKPASLHSGGLFFGEVMDKMNQILPEKDIDAYVYLIQAVFKVM